MIDTHRLRDLETLVSEAAKTIKALAEENARLSKTANKLEAENKQLHEDVRRFSAAAARQDKLRSRLEKISQKLAKLG